MQTLKKASVAIFALVISIPLAYPRGGGGGGGHFGGGGGHFSSGRSVGGERYSRAGGYRSGEGRYVGTKSSVRTQSISPRKTTTTSSLSRAKATTTSTHYGRSYDGHHYAYNRGYSNWGSRNHWWYTHNLAYSPWGWWGYNWNPWFWWSIALIPAVTYYAVSSGDRDDRLADRIARLEDTVDQVEQALDEQTKALNFLAKKIK